MLICSLAEKQALLLDEILENCTCRSPQGRDVKDELQFYSDTERDELIHEFSVIARLRRSLQEKKARWREAETLLSRFRRNDESLSRLEKGLLPDEAELFEIKRSLGLFRLLTYYDDLLRDADSSLTDLSEAEALLNPPGRREEGFHIYSAWSDELRHVREERKLLEEKLSLLLREREELSSQAAREALFEQRAELLNRQKKLEDKELERVAAGLRDWLPALRENFAALGRFDFRLARAELAERWQAPIPEILEPGSGSRITGAYHPLLAAELMSRGLSFTPQSIFLGEGSVVISGANMGGKSVALMCFLLCLLLTQLAICPPCEALSTDLYDFFSYLTEAEGEARLGLSSFAQQAVRIREMLRLSQSTRGLVVMDEACRGTNPDEATAMLQAICRIFARSKSRLLCATHYRMPHEKGIRHYRIRGLKPEAATGKHVDDEQPLVTRKKEDFANALRAAPGDGKKSKSDLEDEKAIAAIHEAMDYTLAPLEEAEDIPAAGLCIAEKMGIDAVFLREMRQIYEENRELGEAP